MLLTSATKDYVLEIMRKRLPNLELSILAHSYFLVNLSLI